MQLRFFLQPVALALPVLLVACGGGGNDAATDTPEPNPIPINLTACAPFKDSFGRSVTCEEMRLLPGAIWGFVDPGGNPGTGAGDAAADGTVADGGPRANTLLEFKDQRSRIVRATTDANGYFRISLRGLTPPLTASVLTPWPLWQSMLVTPLVRAPANRQFYTLNLTGLTHVLATEVAKNAGLSTVASLAPAQVAAQAGTLPGLIAAMNATIGQPLALSGLGLPFDPLTTPFRADGKSGYDRVLRSTSVTHTTDGGATVGATSSFYASGCAVPSFTGVPSQGGGYATMNMVSDGGFCSLYLTDPAGKTPAVGGALLTQPTKGSVVFDKGIMSYTPLYGSSGTDVFSYEMSATVDGQTVPLVVQMTVQITAPTAVH